MEGCRTKNEKTELDVERERNNELYERFARSFAEWVKWKRNEKREKKENVEAF